MATAASIAADRRQGVGKGAARAERRSGRVPGVLYGHGEESVSVSVDALELNRLIQSISVENAIVDLEVKGEKDPFKVLIREVQRHPYRDDLLHIDFFHIAMGEEIHVEVPVILVGVPIGVKDKGGVIDHQLREIEINCLPANIPEKIEIDISELDIGNSIHVGDLKLPDLEIQTDSDRSVVAVLAPTVIVEPEEEEVEEELLEPELVGKEGEAEEEAAAADEAAGEEKA
ncbi:MAG: 50S ribosomal protein L25/general stress protein Ctc [Gemmatimonadetes bacterium]|nr:50S ribosomal protein L25/general stress protein Ctc [Gemmatimonadota bacterium]